MRLLLTLVGDDPVDVVLDAPPGTTYGEVRADLAVRAGRAAPDSVHVGDQLLRDDYVLGLPPLLTGTVLSWRPVAAAPRALVEVHVVGGPDSGATRALGALPVTVGRTPGGAPALTVQDPALSRRHVEVSVGATGVRLRDLASTNGLRLLDEDHGSGEDSVHDDDNGSGLDAVSDEHRERADVTWPSGRRVRAGRTTLALRSREHLPAATRPDGEGRLLVNRAPRTVPTLHPRDHCVPPRPEPSRRAPLPWLSALLPLLVAVPVAWWMRQPAFLAFALLGPVLVLGSSLTERRRARLEDADRLRRWEAERSAATAAARRSVTAERDARLRAHPDAAELVGAVTARAATLWQRRAGDADALHLRVGLAAEQDGEVTLTSGGTQERLRVHDAPAVVRLGEVGVLGVAGASDAVAGLARYLLLQVCAWHGPSEVRVVLVADAHWSWAVPLPHVEPVDVDDPAAVAACTSRLLELVRARAKDRSAGAPWPPVVLVLTRAADLREVPGLADLLARGPSYGVLAICLDTSLDRLPVECAATVALTPGGDTLTGSPGVHGLVADGVGVQLATRVARALAPLTPGEPTSRGDLPRTVRLLDLLRANTSGVASALDPLDTDAVLRRWETTPPRPRVVLGVRADGPHEVDLASDGPHLLVAGTTGAGKSELLQTLVASLALAAPPEHLQLLLVDYKGGAAFGGCERLPHVAGVLTDLDGHLTDRALTSLRSELVRREQLLASYGASDLADYSRRAPDAPLPRLVVVVDEFRALAEELPGFVDGLVRVAAVGRSLGVHLVLATQRPAGVVTADIKANVSLRIALRVRDEVDSTDVVDDPCAAHLPVDVPGRAVLRRGSEPPVTFQAARVAVGDPGPRAAPHVATWRWPGPPPPPDPPASPDPVTDLSLLVDAVRRAVDSRGHPLPPSPLLPPLPVPLTWDEATRAEDVEPRIGIALRYGLLDDPGARRRLPAEVVLGAGHLAVSGAPRSGRTSLAAALLRSVVESTDPQAVHVHVVHGGDPSLGLAVARAPHLGTVAGADDPVLLARLVDRLRDLVDERRARAAGAIPHQLLLVDGWEAVAAALDRVEHGRGLDTLLSLVRDGLSSGLTAVLLGGREVLSPRLASLVPDRVVLRPADPTELLLAGVPSAAVPSDPPPGRGLDVGRLLDLQVAAVSTADLRAAADLRGAADLRATAARCAATDLRATTSRAAPDDGTGATAPDSPAPRPLRLRALPRQVEPDELDPLAVGLGGDAATPLALPGWPPPRSRDLALDPVLVAGPRGSGRTTAVLRLLSAAEHAGHTVALVDARTTAEDLASLTTAPPQVVALDDVERLPSDPASETALHRLVTAAQGVVVAGDAARLRDAYRGPAVVARRARTGLLLGPHGFGDGDLLGVPLAAGGDRVPGRGVLVHDGRSTPVQVALPDGSQSGLSCRPDLLSAPALG